MNENRLDLADWKTLLVGEMLLFGLIGKALQNYPEAEWLQPMINEDIFSQSPWETEQKDFKTGLAFLQAWSNGIPNAEIENRFQDIQGDYMRLFVGIGKVLAPPWESIYLNETHLLFQQETLEVRQWYRRFGLEPEKLYTEPDDHIGLEFSLLAYLAKLGLQALVENDETKFEQTLQAQRQFISEHPWKWVPDWCRLVNEHARTDFYRGMALLAHGALLGIAEQLQTGIIQRVSL